MSLDDPAIDEYEVRLALVEGGVAGGSVTVGDCSFELNEVDQMRVRDLLDDLVVKYPEAF